MTQKRQEFTDVCGKVVEQIVVFEEEDGVNEIDIRFQDKTGFHIRLGCRLALQAAELRDWKEGEGTLVKEVCMKRESGGRIKTLLPPGSSNSR